ncbi:hypothetical protein SK128_010149 [Halocaridina rubra]|uniref:Uncharacterized protein n=1 Tax=Halocaridina rubra TaxID=373956 RepID=A0AAN8XM36_HALRR
MNVIDVINLDQLSFFFFLYYILYAYSRGIPKLLSWLIVTKYQTEIKFGRISLLPLSFEDVLVKKSGLSIKVERIGATSSIFNQEEKKILALKVHDVRIEKEVSDKRSKGSQDGGGCQSVEAAFASALTSEEEGFSLEPIKIRISPSVVTLAQFFGMHIVSVSVMYLREKWPECLLHASAEKITVEGATLNQSNIALKVDISGAHFKVLQHVCEGDDRRQAGIGGVLSTEKDPSLMESTFSLKFSVEANAETVAAMENISVHLSEPQVTIRDRLLIFLEHKALAATPVSNISHLSSEKKPSMDAFLHRYWLFMPLKTQVKFENIGVKFVSNIGQTAVHGTIAGIDVQTHLTREGALENFPALLPDLSTELQIDIIKLQCTHESSVSLSRFNLQSQFVGDRVNIKSEFRSLHLSYDHRDLGVLTNYISRRKISTPVINVVPNSAMTGEPVALKKAFQRYCVGIIVEMWDVYGCGSVPGSPYGQASLQHARHSIVVSQWTAQIAGELIIESLVAVLGSLGASAAAAAAPKKIHIWDTPLYLGMCLVQLSSVNPALNRENDDLPPLQVEALLDNMQLEWSPSLARFIIFITRYVREINSYARSSKPLKLQKETTSALSPSKEVLSSMSIKCTNINVFAMTEKKVSLMARIDSLESQKSSKNSKTIITGTKLVRYVPSSSQYSCIKSAEIKGEFGLVSEVIVENLNNELLLSVKDHLYLTWSTTTHMTLLTLGQEFLAFFDSVRPPKGAQNSTSEVSSEEHSGESNSLQLQLVARGDIRVGAELSSKHKMYFILGDLTYLMANGRISCQSEQLQVQFDEHMIMVLSGGKISRALQSREVRNERESMPELSLKQNKSWKLTVDTWKLTFPYKYIFAEAFSDDLLSVVKWIKKVHNHKPKDFTAESPLPPDIVIRVRHWLMEIGDDPFEVKLRYNYELMEDEYQESCKRLRALDSRVSIANQPLDILALI